MSKKIEIKAKDFYNSIIAQDDDNDYQESGYVVIQFNHDEYAIGYYSHCSCYDTLTALCEENKYGWYDDNDICKPNFIWTGSLEELKKLALSGADPAMPERIADSKDYDYDHLCVVYQQIRDKFPS